MSTRSWFLGTLTIVLATAFFGLPVHAQQRGAKRSPASKGGRQVYTIGESDIAGKINQPQALYLIQKSAVDLEYPKPPDAPAQRAWDTLYLDTFDP